MDQETRKMQNKLVGYFFDMTTEMNGSITKNDYRTYNALFGRNKAHFGKDLFERGFQWDKHLKHYARDEIRPEEEEGDFTPTKGEEE
jgi:hypothetical protein